MKIIISALTLLYSTIITFISNSFILIHNSPRILYYIIPTFIFINIFSGTSIIRNYKKSKICLHGTILLLCFCLSVIFSIVYQISLAFKTIPNNYITFIWSLVLCIGINLFVFWNGIICVYLTSTQLGFKLRLFGIIFGMIPVINLIILFVIIKTAIKECFFEIEKEKINKKRHKEKLCATQYPILLVHGVFFRDTKYFNYWGRIPKELQINGAKIFYGNHPSASSIADSAEHLKKRILEILYETKAEKINIIAHSKGGLDCRYAIAKLGISDKIASLTTINTPHKGCLFADYLLKHIPEDIKNKIANTYNSTLGKFGEKDADFLTAVSNLTDEYCNKLDSEMPMPQNLYCQSIGSVMLTAQGGKFPLNFSYRIAKHFDGINDGLVSEKSFRWSENYTLLKPTGERGISHGDMIDLSRENIDGFDVREFYVNLVYELKNKGL